MKVRLLLRALSALLSLCCVWGWFYSRVGLIAVQSRQTFCSCRESNKRLFIQQFSCYITEPFLPNDNNILIIKLKFLFIYMLTQQPEVTTSKRERKEV
jgi:hypothetical protein